MLRLLHGYRAFLHEVAVALLLLLREGKVGLRLRRLLVGLIDAGFLRGDLRVDIGDVGLGLIDLGLVVTVVDAHQHGAGFDHLVVGHRHVDDGAADLRADRDGAGVDERVVGRFHNRWC